MRACRDAVFNAVQILYMDSDNLPLENPDHMFAWREFAENGNLFWPDYVGIGTAYVSTCSSRYKHRSICIYILESARTSLPIVQRIIACNRSVWSAISAQCTKACVAFSQ